MYGHGFGTLFLAEVYGMVHNQELRERLHDTLKRAVDFDYQHAKRQRRLALQAERADADISVTICQIMALRAARNAGFAGSERKLPTSASSTSRAARTWAGRSAWQLSLHGRGAGA